MLSCAFCQVSPAIAIAIATPGVGSLPDKKLRCCATHKPSILPNLQEVGGDVGWVEGVVKT